MSKEDVEKAVKDAEKFAEEDKKQKEAVDTKNQADNLIFQSEKTLSDVGDKISENEKADIRAAIDKLKETNKGSDIDAIKADTEALQKKFYEMSEKLYKEQAGQNPQGAGFDGADFSGAGQQGGSSDGTYYDADFEDKTNG